MIVAIRNKAGKIVRYMDGPEAQIRLNIPRGGRFEEIEIAEMMRLREAAPLKDPKP